jgi:hypothetical protein
MSEQLQYFAKVENGIVTEVRVTTYQFIQENPDRYGDPEQWIETFWDNSGRGFCSKDWCYDATLDRFYDPNSENVTPLVVK